MCVVFFPGETLKYDVNFRGPLTKRSCTDVCCLFIFIAFCISWGFVARYGEFVSVRIHGKPHCKFESKTNCRLFGCCCCFSFIYLCTAISHGDLDRLMVPADSLGRKCGVDNSVIDKPYLLFFNLAECIDPLVPLRGCNTTQVCVQKCPSTSFIYSHFQCNDNTFNQIRSQLICQMHVPMGSIQKCEDINDRINKGDCASWYLPSNSCM